MMPHCRLKGVVIGRQVSGASEGHGADMVGKLDRFRRGRFASYMSRVFLIAVALLALTGPGRAAENPLLSKFATCAGRFSAELDHAWLMRDERSEEIESRRDQFVDLVNATMSPGQESHAMALRINAKFAHATLLSRATFSGRDERSSWAARRSEFEVRSCIGFLLDS